MNKKGFTLVEIIVSISLVSVVMIFLFQIITTIKNIYDKQNNKNDIKITVAVITREVERDLSSFGLADVPTKTCDMTNNNIVPSTATHVKCIKLIYDENNVKAAKIIDKILQTKFTDNTAEETQRNMLAQKSKIEKIEQIAAEYYELTQFKRTYFLCEGEETDKSGVLIASNGKVKAMNFKIVLNNDQGHTIKFN